MSGIRELFTSKVYIANKTTFEKLDAASRPFNIVYVTDYYDTQGGLFRSDGTSWVSMSGSVVLIGTSDQWVSGSFEGQLGVDAANKALYIWSGTKWVAVATGSSTEAISNIIADTLADAPASAEIGTLLITKDTNKIYWFDGSDWKTVAEELINVGDVYVTVGNITAGSTLPPMTNEELWKMLLQKEMEPTINKPACSLTMDGANDGSYQEIGDKLSLTFTATYEDGSVVNTWGGKETQNSSYAGALKSITYTCPTDGTLDSATTSPNSQTITYTVVSGNQEWKATAAYEAGTYQPVTNFGNTTYTNDKGTEVTLAKCAAGSKTSSVMNFTGVYPVYANKENITSIEKQALTANNTSRTYQMAGETATDKWAVDIPGTWNSVKSFQTADVGSSTFNYMGGGAAESLALWDVTDVTHDVNDNQVGVAYKRYKFKGALQGVAQLKINF
jgi:hypothetical protein